jgi:hypothetical protein
MQSPSPDRCGGLGFQIVAVAFVREFGSEGGRERRWEGNKRVKSIFSKMENAK